MSDEQIVPKMSTGADSTLGNWRDLTFAMFGDSPAVEFFDRKIATAPHGRDEHVLADEGQLLHAVLLMNLGGTEPS